MKTASSPKTSRRGAPHQQRSRETLELILSSAAALLEEVGFEKLSTNLICKRANLTPPALYRYFPNKYAVLKELGERLMARQNAILHDTILGASDIDDIQDHIEHFLAETIRVTREMKAGGWIMRSLHATPVLSDVRLNSHRKVSREMSQRTLDLWPDLNPDRVYQSSRIGIEMGYAAVEMAFDEPAFEQLEILRLAASMLSHNLRQLIAESTAA